ncbi:FAD-dependent oxidoreductase [Halorarum halophilum]|uniref:FAD-dependent oxidoreductase n=1 Tax=Halorarum halophilum TaxID=2743090 RepID=A0A7D5KFW9_9EURY|nr:FAD-dependent oxidoreductase [Halobaculum halophilum]QLG29317.1 FAD-dependent oxidoreductase [Halobaculum halophilum]
MDETITVRSVADVGPDTVAVVFDSPADFDGQPGQFVRLTAEVDGEDESRFYTISSPDTEGSFETTVGLDGGEFSERLASLEAGDDVEMTGPFGEEYYEGEARAVVLAGGPGIGPAVAIAEAALDAGNEAAIVYRDDEPAHEERLDALRERGASVVVTEGGIEDAVADAITGDEGERSFVYGFDDFIQDASEALVAAGGDVEGAKIESFG